MRDVFDCIFPKVSCELFVFEGWNRVAKPYGEVFGGGFMLIRLLFVVSVVFCSLQAGGAVFDRAMFDEFQKEAPVAWARYVQSMSSISGTVTVRNLENGRVTFERSNEYSLLFPFNVKEYSENEVQIVRCAGPNYSFLLEKRADDQNWQIMRLLSYDKPKPSLADWESALYEDWFNESLLERDFHVVQNELLQGLQLYGHAYLPSLVNLPEFSVKGIYKTTVDGVDKVYIDYEFEPLDPVKYETLSVRSGSLVLDRQSWLIESGEFDVELSGIRLRYTVQCSYEANGDSVPKLKQRSLNTSHRGINFSSVFEFDLETDNTISPSRFTLSHYGIPEPDFGERRISPVRYLLLGIGILMVAFALWQMYRKRREG